MYYLKKDNLWVFKYNFITFRFIDIMSKSVNNSIRKK